MLGEGDCIDGRYRIYGEKGKGGGGIVYLAEHLALKKQVVLSRLLTVLRIWNSFVQRWTF